MTTALLEKPVKESACKSCSFFTVYPEDSVTREALDLKGVWGRCGSTKHQALADELENSDTLNIYRLNEGLKLVNVREDHTCDQYRKAKNPSV